MRPPSSSAVAVAVEAPTASTLLSDYKELLKPGITAFVVVMAAAGYLLGATGPVDWRVLLGLMVGTGLTGGGAAALNHVIERKHDARMARTASRPLPGGRMGPVHATLYATACVVAGAVVLAVTTNILTTGLSLLTVALYVGVYTPLKRRTIHNTLVGAVPGALPALGGAAAATGSLDPVGWALFAILYLWQLPHFYALAWMFRDDYQRGGFRMLPTADEGERTLAAIDFMVGDVATWKDQRQIPLVDELRRSWNEDMVWWGPEGIGATYTIERYAEQHSGPFRAAFRDRKFN